MPSSGSQYRFDDVKNDGQTAYGDYASFIGNINIGGNGEQVKLSAEPVRRLGLKLSTFVKPGCFNDLIERLERNPVVGLAGPAGTGRLTLACAALARRHGRENVREIMFRDPEQVLRIRDQDGLLRKGHGYIVRFGGDTPVGIIRALEWSFEEQKASAVLIRESESPAVSPHHAEVFHKPRIRPARLFRRHLVYHLRDQCICQGSGCDFRCGVRYASRLLRSSAVAQAIDLLTLPRDCAFYAERVASKRAQTAEEIIALLPSGEKRRRIRARSILEVPTVSEGYQNRHAQHRRGLRLAYAVCSGHPIAHVGEAGGLLLGKLDELFTHPAIGRPALVNSLPALLGEDLVGDWDGEDDCGNAPASAVTTRMAHVESALVLALLDVAWNEFDNSRTALIQWIDELAAHPTQNFDTIAAVAAAGFACHDFDEVYGSVIGKWAKDRKSALRRAAAAALVAAAHRAASGQLGVSASRRVSSQVDSRLYWLARSELAFERDTAAKAWSMGFRPGYRGQMLRDLTYVAQRANGYLCYEVAEAVRRLAESLGHAWIIALLKRWAVSANPSLESVAGHAFRLLVGSELPIQGQHPVLSLAGTGPEALEDVAVLWRLVLLDPQHAEAGWRLLGHWLRTFRPYPPTTEAFRSLLRTLALDQAVRPRFAYWVSQATAASAPASAA